MRCEQRSSCAHCLTRLVARHSACGTGQLHRTRIIYRPSGATLQTRDLQNNMQQDRGSYTNQQGGWILPRPFVQPTKQYVQWKVFTLSGAAWAARSVGSAVPCIIAGALQLALQPEHRLATHADQLLCSRGTAACQLTQRSQRRQLAFLLPVCPWLQWR